MYSGKVTSFAGCFLFNYTHMFTPSLLLKLENAYRYLGLQNQFHFYLCLIGFYVSAKLQLAFFLISQIYLYSTFLQKGSSKRFINIYKCHKDI